MAYNKGLPTTGDLGWMIGATGTTLGTTASLPTVVSGCKTGATAGTSGMTALLPTGVSDAMIGVAGAASGTTTTASIGASRSLTGPLRLPALSARTLATVRFFRS